MFIKEVKPRLIKDSRGDKTIEVVLKTLKGKFTASAPSGKSKGEHESLDYNEKGIDWSLKMMKALAKRLKEKNFLMKEFSDLRDFENLIKKFEEEFGRLGANCVYALETAFLKAGARENNKELWEFLLEERKAKIPMPVGNCIGGGMHERVSEGKRPDFQEFLFIPDEESFSKAFSKNVHAYNLAGKIIAKKEKKWFIKKNDENAWETKLTNEEVLEIMQYAGVKYFLRIGVDIAASTFFTNKYNYKNKRMERSRHEQIEYVKELIKRYKIFYVEDPLNEEDFSGFADINLSTKNSVIVGDDLTTTSLSRVSRAKSCKAISAMIIKPNQNGYMIDVARVARFCRDNKIKVVFSHRSGETMDDALADYAVGFGADFIKTGIIGRERLIKLRRIMDIERKLKG